MLVFSEIPWHIWSIVYDRWTLQTNLPLHLCSVWLSAYMLARRSYRVYELAYFLGIGGALQALLTPDAGIYGLPHFRAVQTLTAHGAIFLAPIYMTVVEGMRPTLIDALAPWPWYILQLEVIALAIVSLLYLPFFIKDWQTAPALKNQSKHS